MPRDLPAISVVVPVHNESLNVLPLLAQIEAAFQDRMPFEAVFVDDLSSDDTLRILTDFARSHPWLTLVAHRNNCGQSTAVRTGVLHSAAPVIATFDGDGQNDPADIPACWPAGVVRAAATGAAGADRRLAHASARTPGSSASPRASPTACAPRLLGDATPDTGCG
jgi:dolichol-phosphate mannosyltransferase